jgi:alpha-D-ribose 1-methylphosphonate 5-triphosphate synthase subunit PhnL
MMPLLRATGLAKTFTLHLQGGVRLDVLRDHALELWPGECVVLSGPSGAGKSTLLRALYGNYLVDAGEILIRHRGAMADLVTAPPELILEIRRETMGYVSQFLRAMPRVSALDIVAGARLARGADEPAARAAAAEMLERLGIAPRLHALPPATFSGGEQQRVNLARAFICDWPILLLDEPTASLDPTNRDIVIALIREAREKGSAIMGIFHDGDVRAAIGAREVRMERQTSTGFFEKKAAKKLCS